MPSWWFEALPKICSVNRDSLSQKGILDLLKNPRKNKKESRKGALIRPKNIKSP